ncbi:hypothetical protein VHEMI09584 [[Torrubiella] hemipterigena]|uniref:Uncharacterized protein n=1 Tax=[Torrubiella] hemipterigena TaxID=1531966 RepID=A0A0A1TRR3_9HYPO|nr:hypothetical protein VHEMI09584 [[Torrubiella] hemipterigena]
MAVLTDNVPVAHWKNSNDFVPIYNLDQPTAKRSEEPRLRLTTAQQAETAAKKEKKEKETYIPSEGKKKRQGTPFASIPEAISSHTPHKTRSPAHSCLA